MPSLFRATLPNGQCVSICPDSGKIASGTSDLAAQAASLASLLGTNRTGERELLSFLADICPAVFPEADPRRPVQLVHGAAERGVDLIFRLRGRPELGAVQIKKPRLKDGRSVLLSLEQVSQLLDKSVFREPVGTVYVVAGRGNPMPAQTAARARQLQADAGVPIHVLSWDDIINRLTVPNQESTATEFTVLLVELIDTSRRLLRRLVENPGLLYGIDDRKFEELVATLLSDLGLEDVELTPLRKDGGKDVIAIHIDPHTGRRLRYLIECKHWVSGNKVTMRWAMHLLSIARREQSDGAILLSSSGFGPRLIEHQARLSRDGLFLRDGHHLAKWIRIWERQYGSVLLHAVDPRELLELAP
jgi:hypothetical protein